MSIEECLAPDPDALAQALAAARPLVLRGWANDWPAVQAGRQGPAAIAAYLAVMDRGAQAEAFRGPPHIRGRFFYGPDLKGFNFTRGPATVTGLLDQLATVADSPSPPALYMGAAPMGRSLPDFTAANTTTGLPDHAVPRLWLGNAVTVQTHYDLSDNLACVVAGRRTFTLFPPEQTSNLYVGPLEFTLAGQPVSLVDPLEPDLDRFPRFAEAQAAASSVTLEPGDALYIPSLWWHHVRSHDVLNVLVNYWWDAGPPLAGSPFEALIHALLAIRHLPPERREPWKAIFDHYVFSADNQTHSHVPEAARGAVGDLTPEMARTLRAFVIGSLSRHRER
ncbi:cupin-like domain-containing protein [Brevundimonas vitis]|uniref:Cupin-like domain-containing protein n=1 Tax=Brevundimonas vitisensis TaxID=2800818 RepID=A0ABX7BLQ5_9CAUL|nr:cupin-like domain-containing protein [Brevundimonas vitisensis]QQQ18370.1 cupin-like domain-containing protein [Brevundimonas vitisensis]